MRYCLGRDGAVIQSAFFPASLIITACILGGAILEWALTR